MNSPELPILQPLPPEIPQPCDDEEKIYFHGNDNKYYQYSKENLHCYNNVNDKYLYKNINGKYQLLYFHSTNDNKAHRYSSESVRKYPTTDNSLYYLDKDIYIKCGKISIFDENINSVLFYVGKSGKICEYNNNVEEERLGNELYSKDKNGKYKLHSLLPNNIERRIYSVLPPDYRLVYLGINGILYPYNPKNKERISAAGNELYGFNEKKGYIFTTFKVH